VNPSGSAGGVSVGCDTLPLGKVSRLAFPNYLLVGVHTPDRPTRNQYPFSLDRKPFGCAVRCSVVERQPELYAKR
jgi:hypothetical protein